MKRSVIVAVLAGATPLLSGCLPMMAVSAVSMAAQSAQGKPVSNAELKPQAESACTTRAAQYGAVHVIDVQQAKVNRIIVWGTVGEGADKRGFDCHFTTKIVAFNLRPIAPPR